MPSPSRLSRALIRLFVYCTAVLLVACQITPPAPVPPERVHAVFTPTTFAEVPGWRNDRVEEAWPALLVGCKALSTNGRMRAAWQRVCESARTVNPADASAIRAFLETNLRAYRVTDSAGAQAGLMTGYYEPLLQGSRTRTSQFTVPLYAAPDDLLVVDLADLYPELKGKRVRGRLDGRRVVPYWARADIDAGRI
ncbi:MAG TPA: MltA domain-containing protein, partial [Casimicrobiaceae bacterium]|nr:MltA domain-containing protein [Casimicrobiaceae bacterium]